MLAAHPALVLDLRLSEEHADVVDQQIDIGVRVRSDARRALRGAHGRKDATACGGDAGADRRESACPRSLMRLRGCRLPR